MNRILKLVVTGSLLAGMFALSGCGGDYIDPAEQLKIDINIIDKYLADNNITAQRHPSGLRYVIHVPGTGEQPSSTSTVRVTYEGRFLNGTRFDGTNDPIQFQLNGLIAAWQIAIPLLREGGQMTIYAPSGLCYGDLPRPGIPANSILVFDISLFRVVS